MTWDRPLRTFALFRWGMTLLCTLTSFATSNASGISESDIIGQWRRLEDGGSLVEFFEDKTFASSDVNGTWSVLTDGRLKLNSEVIGTLNIWVYDQINLSDGVLAMIGKDRRVVVWLRESDYSRTFNFENSADFARNLGSWSFSFINSERRPVEGVMGSAKVQIVVDSLNRSIMKTVVDTVKIGDLEKKPFSTTSLLYPTPTPGIYVEYYSTSVRTEGYSRIQVRGDVLTYSTELMRIGNPESIIVGRREWKDSNTVVGNEALKTLDGKVIQSFTFESRRAGSPQSHADR